MTDDCKDLAELTRELKEMHIRLLPPVGLKYGYEIVKILEASPEDDSEEDIAPDVYELQVAAARLEAEVSALKAKLTKSEARRMQIPFKHGDIRDVLLAIAGELSDYDVSWTISNERNIAAILIEKKEDIK